HRTARDAQQLLDQAAIPYWEADIRPPERYLMERFVTAAAQLTLAEASATGKPPLNPRIAPSEYRPALRMVSLDIETSMHARPLSMSFTVLTAAIVYRHFSSGWLIMTRMY